MSVTKLELSPLPVDRLARRVTSPARPENLWQPAVSVPPGTAFSREALPTAAIPSAAPPGLHSVVGRRRDRLVVVGYAAKQGSKSKPAKWVVRCDCGNYEHRSSILRWLGTNALDMCIECRKRVYITKGQWADPQPAFRDASTEVLRLRIAGEAA